MKKITRKVENNITVIIPESLDSNLIYCIKKLENFIKRLKLF